MHAASLSTLATYLKASAPKAIASALEQGTFQSLLDLKRTLHLSNATIGYLQAFVMSTRNPTKVQRQPPWHICCCQRCCVSLSLTGTATLSGCTFSNETSHPLGGMARSQEASGSAEGVRPHQS